MMTYELMCPSCRARLQFQDNTGEASLVCPRCRGQVPNPALIVQSVSATPTAQTRAEMSASITVAPPKPRPGDASDEPEVKPWPRIAYFVGLVGTLLAVVGVILIGFPHRKLIGDPPLNPIWVLILNTLSVVLTVFIVYPIGKALYRARPAPTSRRAAGRRTWVVLGFLLVLTPIALFVVFFAVCTSAVLVMRN